MPTKGERRKFGDQIGEWDGQGWAPVDLTPAPTPETTTMPSKAPTWSDRLGLNAPTDSRPVGFMRGAGSGVVDLAQGVVSNVTSQLNAKLDAENQTRRSAALPETATLPRVEQPGNISGRIGSGLVTAAEMAVPTGTVASKAYAAIPSAKRAGQTFQSVMAAAKDVPVNLNEAGDVALRIAQLAEHGGSMPMAVRKFLVYATDPNKPAMTYSVSRDFASNISRLSADEMGRLTPVVAKEVANLRVALDKANAMAAKRVGKQDEYQAAMKEYAKSMRLRNAINDAVEAGKRGIPLATAAGVGYWLTNKVRAALSQ